MAVFDLDSYVNTLKEKYKIEDADLAGVSEIKSGFMRQDDYSRKQQELQRERQTVQSTYDQLQQYEANIQAFEQRYGSRDAWPAALEAYVQNQNPNPQPTGVSEQVVMQLLARQRQELEAQFAGQLETVGQGSAAFAEFVYDARDHWQSTYGTKFPKEDFRKFYTENGHNNPTIALALFEKPYAEEKAKKDWEQKIEQARLEGAASERSRMGVLDGMGIGAGGWAGDVSISVGAADSRPDQPVAGTGEVSRDQQFAKWSQGFDKRLAAITAAQGGTGSTSTATSTPTT